MERTAQTAEASTVHKPFAVGGKGLWGTGKQLPAYIQSVAHHLVTQGLDESRAIGEAVGIVKNWADGHDGHGHAVHADVQAAAKKAIAEWERLRAQAHATRGEFVTGTVWIDRSAFNSAAHPRVAAGNAGGGEFAPASQSSSASSKTAKGGKAAKRPTPTNQHPVGMGEQGKRVSDLQKRLNALGAHLAVDGIFGPKTLAAVKAYQKAHGLKVDGLVGPKTTAALRTPHKTAKAPAAHHAAKTAVKTPVKPAVKPPAKPAAPVKAARSATVDSGYDEDGLDASWDGDLSDLPDLTGLTVADFEAVTGPDDGVSRMAKLGSGARYKALKAKLAAKGASDPGALAAYIGRKKYGKSRFASIAGKARHGKRGGGMHRSELMRIYPLEDIHILTRAEGDGTGRVVEAYATVFDAEAEIRDGQGHYKEIIDRSAFDQILGRITRSPGGLAAQVKVLFNHGRTIGGVEAPEFQLPLGKPLDVRPEARGLLTRTEYDASDPFTERVLSKIHAGTITAQSFVGGIMRSTPELKGPGDRYRGRNGVLPTVRRMVLGLREYGPVLYPAYSGAEILGVRMSIPGATLDDIDVNDVEDAADTTEVEEFAPDMEDGDAGGIPEEVHPTRDHAHRLLVTRTQQMLREAGIAPRDRGW